jgi:hypothetical protein
VVIVSWNVRELLLACLASLERSEAPCRTVVVDNASADGSEAAVRSAFPNVEWIQNTENAGFTRANNQGLRHLGVLDPGGGDAAPSAVLLLNPDTAVAPDAIGLLLGCLDDNPRTGVVGPALLWPDGRPQSSRRRFPTLATALCESTPLEWHWPDNRWAAHYRMDGSPDAPGLVDWLSGAALMLRTGALRKTGGLDERFFMYSEETDWCRRIKAAGWRVVYFADALVVHHEARSSEQNLARRNIAFNESKCRYAAKHFGPTWALALRLFILLTFVYQYSEESAKLAVGHRPSLRRDRLTMLREVIAWQARHLIEVHP